MSEKVERLLNLVVALLETRRPLTLEEVKAKVRGYGHDDPESARRQFERDKDDLRRLGVPLETVPVGGFDAEWGYRIDRRAYELPALDLSRDEMTALMIALHLTGEEQARLGVTKVAAVAPDPRAGAAPTARITVGLDDLAGLAEALVERRTLVFGYRTAAGEESTRTVDPYGLVQRGGAWYVVGHDHDRDAQRAFRVDRMTTRPAAQGEPGAFTPPDDFSVAAVGLGPEGERVDVRVRLTAEAAALVARGAEVVARDGDVVEVLLRDVDAEGALARVLALGSAAEILAPPSLRSEAADRLRSVAAGHGHRQETG